MLQVQGGNLTDSGVADTVRFMLEESVCALIRCQQQTPRDMPEVCEKCRLGIAVTIP